MHRGIPTVWRIAWRNLWRNPRRTGLAIAAIGLSVTLVLLYDGVLRWEADWMVQTITGPMLGHVQTHAREWRRTRAMDKTLREVTRAIDAVRAVPGVAGVDARLYAPALAALGQEGFAVLVMGVDIEQAAQPARLLEGVTARPGRREVLMGYLLAAQMGVKAGDRIAVVGQGVDGSLANDLLTVTGIVNTKVDMVNRQAIVMPIREAQDLFAMSDEAHELVIYAREGVAPRVLASRLQTLPELEGDEVLDWQTAEPSMKDLVQLLDVMWIFVLVLVFVAAAAGVANTALMSTFERTHEFGMLLALGTAPARIVSMIVLESLALGTTGALVGTALGASIVALAYRHGLDFAAVTGGGPTNLSAFGMNFTLVIHPRLAAIDIVRVVVAVVITSLVASSWPALRAARLQPAAALRA